MPTTTIEKCRPLVQERKEFTASMLRAKWEYAEDGTHIYVVRSISKRHGYPRSDLILFAYHDGVWCEPNELPYARRRARRRQMYLARPTDGTVRMDSWQLRAFVRDGMAHHPKMQRLLAVSV